jgi:predicted ATPase/DNA-binding winged helix-turn-helix (wHTH) protein
MKTTQIISFPPFRLDLLSVQLWRDGQRVPIRAKALEVLLYLAGNPDRLITKDELLHTVWAKTHVSKSLPKDYIQELRRVLDDDPKSPKFIETVHGRGYRFIAPLSAPEMESNKQQIIATDEESLMTHDQLPTLLVGRDSELAQLHAWMAKVLRGERQIVFVTGEPGIGKTTLVEAFLQQAAARNRTPIARGQCHEHYGAGEAYMPMLDALTHFCRDQRDGVLLTLLSQQAPTWLVQMPSLVSTADLESLQRRIQGATRERMLREMGEALETLTREQPLILVLEDLHWSDYSTLDLITVLAQRTSPAKLLVIATYRPTDVHAKRHPLNTVKHELQMHRQCEELTLGFLKKSAVSDYLAIRFPHNRFPAFLGQAIHRRTEGNPLFMVNMVEYLTNQGLIAQQHGEWEVRASREAIEHSAPTSLRQIIEQHLENLDSQDRRLLEAASVAGAEFTAAAVAGGVSADEEAIEERCASLARTSLFLHFHDYQEWPDGSITGRYSFIHSLYQEVLYNRITPNRRFRLHKSIGEREEAGYRERRGEIAGELALHFERGRDYERAVRYLHVAGENALRRCAYQEAVEHSARALELLKLWPESPKRIQQELPLHATLGVAFIATKGYASTEVEQAYARARELCRQVGETPQLFPILWGLWVMYFVRGKLHTAWELSEQLLRLARDTQDPALLLEAHVAGGLTAVCRGEFATALELLEQGSTLYSTEQHSAHAFVYGQDPGMVCLSWAAWALWFLGYPDRAQQKCRAALELARRLAYPYSLAYALGCAAVFHQFRRHAEAVSACARENIALSSEQGFTLWLAAGRILLGWALTAQGHPTEGIVETYNGLKSWQSTGAGFLQSYGFALLPEAYQKTGQVDEGLAALTSALTLVEQSGEHLWEAELHRLTGELTLQQGASNSTLAASLSSVQASSFKSQISKKVTQEAERSFLKALAIARQQQAKSLELRAVMSLSWLWKQQGKKKDAKQLLQDTYNWFTEGFETADLCEARALLAELSS